MGTDKYKQNLETRLEVALRINKNVLAQQQAINDNDIKFLGKLLKRQQGNIDKLLRISKQTPLTTGAQLDAESKQLEDTLDSLLKEAIRINTANVAYAEALKASIGKSICSLKTNRNAIRNGYFGVIQPRRGRYIDKKK